MPIVNSSYLVAVPQVDGRSYVLETHIDQYGQTYGAEYLAEVGADYSAIMNARAGQISQGLIDGEIAALLNNGT